MQPNRNTLYVPFHRRVAVRLVVWSLLAAGFVGLCLSGLKLWQDYQRQDAHIDANTQQVLVTIKGIAAQAARNRNKEAATQILLGLMRHRSILSASIEVRNPSGDLVPLHSESRGVVAVGFLSDLTHEIFSDSREFVEPLFQKTNLGLIRVGRLRLRIDTAPDGQQFIQNAKRTFLYGLLRAVVFASVLIALAYYIFTRPFRRMTNWLEKVEVSDPVPPPQKISRRQDEIAVCVQAVNDLLQRSAAQQEQLRVVEARANYLRRYDRTTDLLNRTAFAAQVEEVVEAARGEVPVAIISVDIDAFRAINENYGALFGDNVLFEVARRFEAALENRGVLARAAADNFVIMLPGGESEANAMASELQFSLADPLVVDGHQLVVTVSIGFALTPDHGCYRDELTQYAEQALQAAKESGGNRIQAYNSELSELRKRHEDVKSGFRYALQTGEVELHYQPQFDVHTQTILACEALVRWEHKEYGHISPAEFVPLLEQSNQAVLLGNWVIQQACTDLAMFNEVSREPIKVAVNVSALQLVDNSLVDVVKTALSRSRLSPDLLELEITESALIRNHEAAARTLGEVRDLGVHIVIDDFGTGHSSLLNLRRLPVDKIKIDRSFIKNLPSDHEDGQVVAAIIGLGENLKLGIIAEGIETQAQLDFVKARGCNEYQGFFGSRALPSADIRKKLVEAAA